MGEVLGARNPTTIREHLEWIASGHVNGNPLGWIVDATKHAAAALAILDNADTLPWCDDGSIHPIVRLVPDPDPGVGAEHAPDYSAIWECPDGLRAKSNCYAECQRRNLPPCLSCMESFA